MSCTTLTSIRTLYPQYSDLSDDFINAWIEKGEIIISEDQFKDKYCYAIQEWVCHKLYLRFNGLDETGSVSSEKVGDVSISYDVGGSMVSSHLKEYMRMVKTIPNMTSIKGVSSCL